jgi:hypothetical protein
MVELMVALSKQGRKRSAELCVASQNLSDFYRKSESREIEQKSQDVIKNTGYKFIMKSAQELETVYQFIESSFPITDKEKDIIKRLTRGQGLFINSGSDKIPIFVVKHHNLTKLEEDYKVLFGS